MRADERPLKRGIKTQLQLAAIAVLLILFTVFIRGQLAENNSIKKKAEGVRKGIALEAEENERLSKEYDFLKDKNFIIQQGRDRLGLVMENDIVYIRRVID